MKKKQTAVQWLANEILKLEGIQDVAIPDNLFHIASQMEREQHKQTWFDSSSQFANDAIMDNKIYFETYYTQTFNQ